MFQKDVELKSGGAVFDCLCASETQAVTNLPGFRCVMQCSQVSLVCHASLFSYP